MAKPFRETTLDDVRAFSGPRFCVPGNHLRYVPFRVGGARIAAEQAVGSRQSPGESWHVLDSADCWREVATFDSGLRDARELDARALAATMNRRAPPQR